MNQLIDDKSKEIGIFNKSIIDKEYFKKKIYHNNDFETTKDFLKNENKVIINKKVFSEIKSENKNLLQEKIINFFGKNNSTKIEEKGK